MEIVKGDRGGIVKIIQTILQCVPDGIFGHITEEAVKAFQKKYDKKVDGKVDDEMYKHLILNEANIVNTRDIIEIIIHCTATPEGREVTVADLDKLHRERGFKQCGYHYVVHLDGKISMGRAPQVVGAHCLNHNANSIGVVYVGGLVVKGYKLGKLRKNEPIYECADTRTERQKTSLYYLLKNLIGYYPGAVILGHRDTSPDLNGNGIIEPSEYIKACPCFDAREEYQCIIKGTPYVLSQRL